MPEKVVTITSAAAREQIPVSAEPDLQTDTITIPVKLCNLQPLNSIANQVLSLSADPNVDLRHLAFVMEGDPAFAAEILLLANSSLFGFTSRMSVLRHAVAVLGLDRIKALAVTVAMRAFLGQGSPLVRQCWRHSAACAVIAEEISPIFAFSSDQAYTAALMHDIGRLGLLKSYARDFTPVVEGHYTDQAAILSAERAALHVDHGSAGAWLVNNWAYPQSFADVCAHHHDPLHPKDSVVLRLVKVACRMADALDYLAVPYQEVASYSTVIAQLPPGIRGERFPAEDELRENVKARLAVFELQA
ncbi:MAG: HDOD domain-containing protein [Acidobacteriia bacterium]|nr:HDOD domain-containing protein [Terriglobia bacterium]